MRERIVSRRDRDFIIVLFSVLCGFGFIWWIYNQNIASCNTLIQKIYSSNVCIYIVTLLIVGVAFIVLNVIRNFTEKLFSKNREECGEQREISKNVSTLITAAFVIAGLALFVEWAYVEQFKEPGIINGNYHSFPKIAVITAVILLFVWEIVYIKQGNDFTNISVWFCYAACVLSTFLLYYVPNQFSLGANDIWSADLGANVPCTETMYNAADGVPYDFSTTGLYGHYSLFLALPFRILGVSNPYAPGILLVGISCLSQIAVLYVIDKLAPKNWLKVIFALASILFVNFYFPGVYPIRTFTPAIMCAFLTYLFICKKNVMMKKEMWIGIVLCGLSLVWNFENGFAATVGFGVFLVMEILQKKRAPVAKSVLEAGMVMLIMIISAVVIALGIVNIYNIACGGTLIFRAFFYPLLGNGGDYMLDLNRCNVDLGNHLWIPVMVLFLGSLCYGIYDSELFRKGTNHSAESRLMTAFATTGFVAFSYYFNEAHWGAIFITHYIAIALLVLIVRKLWCFLDGAECVCFADSIKRSALILIIGVISMYALRTVNIPVVVREKMVSGAYRIENVVQEVESMASELPENVYGVGMGTNIIWHILGWDNHAKFRDTSALASSSGETYGIVLEEILKQDAFVICKSNSLDQVLLQNVLEANSQYVEVAEYEGVGGHHYALYVDFTRYEKRNIR